MDLDSLSLAELNDKVVAWLTAVDSKTLSEFGESRAERFAREQPHLKSITVLPFDARRDIPVLVNRESMIRHETNSYSVPPEYIGQVLLLKVHPFAAEAEVLSPNKSIKRFGLTTAGSKEKRMFPEDRASLAKQWNAERARIARIRKPKAPVERRNTAVDVRSPSTYDGLFVERFASVTP